MTSQLDNVTPDFYHSCKIGGFFDGRDGFAGHPVCSRASGGRVTVPREWEWEWEQGPP